MEQQSTYKTDPKPTPKVDVLHGLLDVFSVEQLSKIEAIGKSLKEAGHGELVIRFNNGHPRFFIRESEIVE